MSKPTRPGLSMRPPRRNGPCSSGQQARKPRKVFGPGRCGDYFAAAFFGIFIFMPSALTTWPRISPPGFAAVWTLKYIMPVLSAVA